LSEVNNQIIEEIVRIRKEKKVKLPDAVIVGTSIASNAVLLTADDKLLKYSHKIQKDFNHIHYAFLICLFVAVWLQTACLPVVGTAFKLFLPPAPLEGVQRDAEVGKEKG
jgi:hypothetical protein